MKPQNEELEVVKDVPASQPKLTVVVILAMLLGSLVTLIAAGAGLHYQQRAAWDAEVMALNDALQEKDRELKEMHAQNALLAKHLKVLKGYSIASSSASSEKAVKTEAAATPPVDSVPVVAEKNPGASRARVQPGAKRTKAETQDCELAGKTPEQQAVALQRCVGLAERPGAKPRQ